MPSGEPVIAAGACCARFGVGSDGGEAGVRRAGADLAELLADVGGAQAVSAA